MKIHRRFTILFIGTFLAGCFQPFQPPPDLIDTWKKTGYSKFDIKREMIQCGYTNMTFGYKYPYPYSNTIATNNECMRIKGFVNIDNNYYCDQDHAKSLPACENRKLD